MPFRTLLLLPLLLLTATPVAARQTDAEWFANMNGLQTVVARSWTTPFSELQQETTASPAASPVPTSSVVNLSVFIYAFESPDQARAASTTIDNALYAQTQSDPNTPAVDTFEMGEIGDIAYGYQGTVSLGASDLSVTFAIVQDGRYVYSLNGVFTTGTQEDVTRGIMRELVATPADSKPAQYATDGSSSGGLWTKMNGIHVDGSAGTMVTDLEVWPQPNTTRGETVTVPQVDPGNPSTFPGLTSWQSATYAPAVSASPVASSIASPAPAGVSSIEMWIIGFDSELNATAAAFSMQSALIEPLRPADSQVVLGEHGQSSMRLSTDGVWRDRNRADGHVNVWIEQRGTVVIALRTTAVVPNAAQVNAGLIESLLTGPESGGTPVSEEAIPALPADGTPALYGLEMVGTPHAIPMPAASPEARSDSARRR